MYILGINSAYHESAACLVGDGEILAAAEEERFNRVKHAKTASVENADELPTSSIRFCLQQAGIDWADIDHIGYSFSPEQRRQNVELEEPVEAGTWGSPSGEDLFYQHVKRVPERLSEIAGRDISEKFRWLKHHLCHAASAFFVSPFDDAAILSVDGIGEFVTCFLGHGKDNKIASLKEIEYPNSLGFLWEKLAKFLGFTEYDAAKVMGLAAYGDVHPYSQRRYDQRFHSFVSVSEGDFAINNDIAQFRGNSFSGLESLLGKPRLPGEMIEHRHAEIAAALQRVTEEILLSLANYLHRQTGSRNLCIAGGVGLNCVASKALQERGPFENLYVQPAAHDAGTAIGAAYYIWNEILGNSRAYVLDDPFLGPEYSDSDIKSCIDGHGLKYEHYEDIERVTAKLVSELNIVGWFQGKMEIGPRALGNRTLLADPRNSRTRDILNMKVKHREYFRPFAPSVLEDRASDWFKMSRKSLSSDFMLLAYDIQETKANLIPAVIHVDRTSRIQTVNQRTNPKFYKLIQEFDKLTGVPMVLNTSFNDREPIVCSPEDAIGTFLRTDIDYLAVGNYLISRERNHE